MNKNQNQKMETLEQNFRKEDEKVVHNMHGVEEVKIIQLSEKEEFELEAQMEIEGTLYKEFLSFFVDAKQREKIELDRVKALYATMNIYKEDMPKERFEKFESLCAKIVEMYYGMDTLFTATYAKGVNVGDLKLERDRFERKVIDLLAEKFEHFYDTDLAQ